MKAGLRTFIVGFLVGMLVSGLFARHFMMPFGPHHMSPEKRQERMLRKLTRELKLDKGQQESIRGILEDGRKKMDEVMGGVRPRFEEVRKEINGRIRDHLDPAQQQKFDVLNEKMEKRWRERHGEPGPEARGDHR